jgi:hypothetical protein
MFNIREIRDTPRRVRVSPNVELQAVYFDSDLAIENVVRGHAFEAPGPHDQPLRFVPSQRQLGFVQLISHEGGQQSALTPSQLRELLDQEGPVGGPLDCELDIGQSGQRMRATAARVDVAPRPGGGDAEFAVATYGAPELPREGQWSVVRVPDDPLGSPEPGPADQRLGVPIVRVGPAATSPSANTNAYRFADPADLHTSPHAANDYALLLATQTFRVLFPRPKIDPGAREITSDLAPLVADAHSLLQATGLFPRLKHAITFPSNDYSLQLLGGGGYRLSPSPLRFTVPQPRVLEVAKTGAVDVFT